MKNRVKKVLGFLGTFVFLMNHISIGQTPTAKATVYSQEKDEKVGGISDRASGHFDDSQSVFEVLEIEEGIVFRNKTNLTFYDWGLNKKWSSKINELPKKLFYVETYSDGNHTCVVQYNCNFNALYSSFHIVVLNSTGKVLHEKDIKLTDKLGSSSRGFVTNNKFTIICAQYESAVTKIVTVDLNSLEVKEKELNLHYSENEKNYLEGKYVGTEIKGASPRWKYLHSTSGEAIYTKQYLKDIRKDKKNELIFDLALIDINQQHVKSYIPINITKDLPRLEGDYYSPKQHLDQTTNTLYFTGLLVQKKDRKFYVLGYDVLTGKIKVNVVLSAEDLNGFLPKKHQYNINYLRFIGINSVDPKNNSIILGIVDVKKENNNKYRTPLITVSIHLSELEVYDIKAITYKWDSDIPIKAPVTLYEDKEFKEQQKYSFTAEDYINKNWEKHDIKSTYFEMITKKDADMLIMCEKANFKTSILKF